MRNSRAVSISSVLLLLVFLIGCANRNGSPQVQTYPSNSNNIAPSGIANKNDPHYTHPHQTDSNDPALAWILNGDYQIVKSFYDLPEDVRTKILPEPPESIRLGQMAEPNQEFNRTDVIVDNLPMRRFITGGFSKDYAFVFYEHGGRGYNQPFVILKRKSGEANIILLKYFFGEKGTMSLDQLKSYFKSGKPPCIMHESNEFRSL